MAPDSPAQKPVLLSGTLYLILQAASVNTGRTTSNKSADNDPPLDVVPQPVDQLNAPE